MIIERLAVEGFLGYRRRCELDFQGKHTIGICGSNEAGKSTLLRAISFALYGEVPTPQGSIREVQLINDRSKQMMVEVDVRLSDDSVLTIRRGRTAKNEPVLRTNRTGTLTKPSIVQTQIKEALSVGYEDFVALSYFVQGDIHQFMSGSKREYFQRWTAGLRQWKRLEKASLAVERDIVGALRTAERDLAAVRRTLESASEIKADLRVAKASVQKAQQGATLVNDQVQQLKADVKAQEYSEEMRDALDSLVGQQHDTQHEIDVTTQRLRTLQRELRNIRTGQCPLLSVQCRKLETSGAQQRKQTNVKLREQKDRKLDLEERDAKLVDQVKAIKRKVSNAPVSQLRSQLAQAKRELLSANRALQSAVEDCARAEVRWESAVKARERKRQLVEDVATRSEELRHAQFVRYMCSKSGIPAQRIEAELNHVETRCNWVLERLDYHKSIRFSGHKELASYERVCPLCGGETWHKRCCKKCGAPRQHKRKEEPTITILDGSSERAFALESGGAQTLQSFAVRLAGGLFVSSLTGVPMRLVMLDEVFAHLDASNRQKLMALVVDKLGSVFGLRQQFVVSHHEDIINVVDHMLVVKRKRGSSVAGWA